MNKKTITLIKEKNEWAFEELYNEYKNLVYYVIFQIVKDNDAADSLLQDTFLTVYNKIDQYNGGNFKYWLLQIAKNLSKNYVTRVQVKEKRVINDYDMIREMPDTHTTGLGKYDEILSESFSQEEKDIIVYHVVFGYKFKEIAKMMDKTPKYVSLKYKLSLEVLKQIMEG
ncbi:MAG: sigma-70 family RNA polymerase sigma factor [Coprobacillus sp.]|nr:sigma-70 family RNA polymerase sigma factor [Coprobacillus sp.]